MCSIIRSRCTAATRCARSRSCASLEESVDGFTFPRTPASAGVAHSSAPPALLRQMAATRSRLADLIRMHKPDVVHAHSPILDVFPALWAGRRAGVPVVYEVRARCADAATDHGTKSERSVRYKLS